MAEGLGHPQVCLFITFCSTDLGEVQPPVRSWRWWDPAADRPPRSLCHPHCWRSCKSHKWRLNNTAHTGFGQMWCMRGNPAENNINCEPALRHKEPKKSLGGLRVSLKKGFQGLSSFIHPKSSTQLKPWVAFYWASHDGCFYKSVP